MYSTHTNDENISSFFKEGRVQNGDKSTSNGRDIDLFPTFGMNTSPPAKSQEREAIVHLKQTRLNKS